MFRLSVRLLLCTFLYTMQADAFEISPEFAVVTADGKKVTRRAAEELSYYLGQILDADISVQSNSNKKARAIFLSCTPDLSVKEDGFVIKAEGERLFITAADERGLLYGVYYFLDTYLGCKFLTDSYEYIPHIRHKKLPDFEDRQEPAFAYRELFFKESDDLLFSYKLLLNGRLGHRTEADTEVEQAYASPVKTYTYLSSKLLKDRYRCNGQYNYANPDARKEALRTFRKELRKLNSKDEKYIVLDHEDRGSFCTHGIHEGELPSRPFLGYVHYLAKNAHKLTQRSIFFYQAYLWSRKPPHQVKRLPSYLGIHFAGIEADFSRPLKSRENIDIWNDLLAWSAFSQNVVVWHYGINFGGYIYPYPSIEPFAQDLRDFQKLGFIRGVFLQGSYDTYGGDLAPLRNWVFAKLLWNPKQRVDALIEEFCHYYYEEAAEEVMEYIETVRRFQRNSGEKLGVKVPIDAAYLNNENLNRLDKILEKGVAKLDTNSPAYDHMLALFTGIDYIRLIRGDTFADRKKILQRFVGYMQKHPEITAIAEGIGRDEIMQIVHMKRKKAAPPSLAKGLQKGEGWFAYQEYQLELCCADIVKDSLASDGVSAVMDGSSSEWGFSLPLLNLPEGVWRVYADVRVVPREPDSVIDKAKLALKYGIYPTDNVGIALLGQFDKGYKPIYIGTIDTAASSAESVWLSPPGNEAVDKVYVDRIYFIKEK